MAEHKLIGDWGSQTPSVPVTQSPPGSEWSLWIVEEGTRWQQIMRVLGERFVGSVAMQCCRVEPRAVLTEIGQPRCSVVLWELSPENIGECCPLIAALSRRNERPLQLVTFVARMGIPSRGYSELALTCRQVGADWVVRQPEDMPLVMRLIANRLCREFKGAGDLDK